MYKIVLVCILAVYWVFAEDCKVQPNKVIETCNKNMTGYKSEPLLSELVQMKIPQTLDGPGKCYISCIVRGMIGTDNKINVTKVKDVHTCMKAEKATEPQLNFVQNFLNDCTGLTLGPKDSCELSGIMVCLFKNKTGLSDCLPQTFVKCLEN